METDTQGTGSRVDCKVMESITLRMRVTRGTILQTVKMAREKRFSTN